MSYTHRGLNLAFCEKINSGVFFQFNYMATAMQDKPATWWLTLSPRISDLEQVDTGFQPYSFDGIQPFAEQFTKDTWLHTKRL